MVPADYDKLIRIHRSGDLGHHVVLLAAPFKFLQMGVLDPEAGEGVFDPGSHRQTIVCQGITSAHVF